MKTLFTILLSTTLSLFAIATPGNSVDNIERPIAVEMFQFNNVTAHVGLMDDEKNIIVDAQYDFIGKFVEDRAVYKLNGKYGILNEFGQEVTGAIYDEVNDFSEGYARVKLNGSYGYIDLNGDELVKPKFAWASDFYGDAAEVMTDDGITYMIYTEEHVDF